MIHDCRACRHNGLQSYRGTPCKTCKDKGSLVEADFVHDIRAEERARIIALIEKKRDGLAFFEGHYEICNEIIAELRGES